MQIHLDGVNKTYDSITNSKASSSVHAVCDVSLNIPSNVIFGIIGKSGAGKSSLIRQISLLEKPDSGEIYYDDLRVDNLPKKELIARRRRCGMIFQNFNLFSSRTASQNIAYPLEIIGKSKREIKPRTAELLELVGLSDRADAPISTLSGGQKQRIAIARALANNPDVLFCDEATSALDPQTTHSILSLIREIQKKMNLTVVMITHQMEVVRDSCDLVAVLDDGKIAEQGTVNGIFTHPQTSVTRGFLSNLVPVEVDDDSIVSTVSSCADIIRWSKDGGKYTLRFAGLKTGEPVLCNMARKFNIEFNIRAGGIQHLASEDVGTLITDITGSAQEVQKSLEWLKQQGVTVEYDEHNGETQKKA